MAAWSWSDWDCILPIGISWYDLFFPLYGSVITELTVIRIYTAIQLDPVADIGPQKNPMPPICGSAVYTVTEEIVSVKKLNPDCFDQIIQR